MDVTVSTADGSATAGEDYTTHSRTVTFARSVFSRRETSIGSGEYRWKAPSSRANITLRDDQIVEGR